MALLAELVLLIERLSVPLLSGPSFYLLVADLDLVMLLPQLQISLHLTFIN